MSPQEYIEQNAKGFEGDWFLHHEIICLVEEHGISLIIETGTYMGATTLQFAGMADRVETIEANPEYYAIASAKFNCKNISHHLGRSEDILGEVLSKTENTLFFLDAHWGSNNPLLQELKIITDAKIRPVIVIHDFKVPGFPEFGFDSYDGQDYEWDWIAASIEEIYGKNGYTYHYNSVAEGAKRGVIFIEPK